MSKKPCRTCGGRTGGAANVNNRDVMIATARAVADKHGAPCKVSVNGIVTVLSEKEGRRMQSEGYAIVWPTEKEQARPDAVAQRDTENVPSEGDTADPESAPTRKRRTNSGAENESEQQ